MSWVTYSDSDDILKDLEGDQSYHTKQEMSMKNTSEEWNNDTDSEINLIVNQLLLSNGSGSREGESWLENSKINLSDWQKSELESVKLSESGIRCLLNSWLVTQRNLLEGKLI